MTKNSANVFLLLTFGINVANAFYNYYFENTKKAIKYYEIFLLEKKKSQPIQFLQDNLTLLGAS